jgi:hypothetical protein
MVGREGDACPKLLNRGVQLGFEGADSQRICGLPMA